MVSLWWDWGFVQRHFRAVDRAWEGNKGENLSPGCLLAANTYPTPTQRDTGLRKYWAFLLVAQALTSHSQPTMSLLPWLQEAV